METKKELNKKILSATQKIQDVFPELNRYVDEIPDHHASIPYSGVSKVDLKNYLDSLNGILSSPEKC